MKASFTIGQVLRNKSLKTKARHNSGGDFTRIIILLLVMVMTGGANEPQSFYTSSKNRSLSEVIEKWTNAPEDMYIGDLVKTKDPEVINFLHQVAIQDPNLLKGQPSNINVSIAAIRYLGSVHTKQAANILASLLHEYISNVAERELWETRTEVARQLLNQGQSYHDTAYAVFDEAFAHGIVSCPWPLQFSNGGIWNGGRLDRKAETLVRQWLNSPKVNLQVQAALCAAESKIDPDRAFDIANRIIENPAIGWKEIN